MVTKKETEDGGGQVNSYQGKEGKVLNTGKWSSCWPGGVLSGTPRMALCLGAFKGPGRELSSCGAIQSPPCRRMQTFPGPVYAEFMQCLCRPVRQADHGRGEAPSRAGLLVGVSIRSQEVITQWTPFWAPAPF